MIVFKHYLEQTRVAVQGRFIYMVEEMEFDPPSCRVTVSDGRQYMVHGSFDEIIASIEKKEGGTEAPP